MYRLKTKEQRENVQKYEIDSRTAKGWQRENYKKLVILTNTDERGIHCLFVLCGTAAHPIVNELYKQEERRAKRIEDLKQTQDFREKRKEEEKKNPRKNTAANCAAAIREELKKFKGIKFTVRSENFSMGNSVHIGWTDGPTTHQVEEITGKYQYGHFNGMEDIYEYSNRRDDIPQAKYVQTSRSEGAETRKVMEEEARRIRTDAEGWEGDRERNDFIYRLWSKTAIPAGAKVTGIDRTGIECGSLEDIYKLRIEGGETAQEQSAPAPASDGVEFGPVQVIDYSPKAYAVTGDTRPIQKQLEQMGGKFNRHLTCGPGYIFSKRTRPIEKTTAALQALRGAIPTAEEVEATDPDEVPTDYSGQEAAEAREDAQTASIAASACYDREEDIPTAAQQLKREQAQRATMAVTHRTEPRALLQAGIESGRVMIVTTQTPAAWSKHGAGKVHAQSDTARAILAEVQEIVKEASTGKVSSAQAMEEAAAKIERIDTPKATETAASLRTMAAEHRAKLEESLPTGTGYTEHDPRDKDQPTPHTYKRSQADNETAGAAMRMQAHAETKQMYLF